MSALFPHTYGVIFGTSKKHCLVSNSIKPPVEVVCGVRSASSSEVS